MPGGIWGVSDVMDVVVVVIVTDIATDIVFVVDSGSAPAMRRGLLLPVLSSFGVLSDVCEQPDACDVIVNGNANKL